MVEREQARARRGRPALRSPTLVVALVAAALFWLLAAVGLAIDPYDVYRWGAPIQLRSNYEPDRAGYLGWMAARDREADVILVGSSTALLYTPDAMRAAFPRARHVWNLSYKMARPQDRDMLLRLLAAHARRGQRIIITLDYFYSGDAAKIAPNFPAFLFDGNPVNDLRLINGRLPGILLSVLRTGEPFVTGPPIENSLAARFAMQYRENRLPAVQDSWRAALERYRSILDAPGRTRCRNLVPFERQLLPVVRQLAARGVQVDILVPPYSPLMYFTFLDPRDQSKLKSKSFLEDQMLLRRCAVAQTARLPSVAVWAADRDFGLISNIDNYRDPGHLAWEPKQQRTLQVIGDPRYRLTPDNVDEYVERMRQLVVNFRLNGGQSEDMSR